MSKIGAAKVMTATGPVWCHFSQSANTTKLRRYSEGTAFEIEADDDDIVEFVPLEQCKNLVPAKSYSFDNAVVWSQILQSLETGSTPNAETPIEPSEKPPLVVPITELRRIYDVMKLFDKATTQNMAAFFADTPASLERLWELSRKAFSSYNNPDNWGRGTTEELPVAPAQLGVVSSTNEFTAYLKARPLDGYTFVEREINPWRTRSGVFSNKLPATKSGRGGMDLLLRSARTGSPVVGEVKVKGDKNAFYALIQAMTYAVEMSTAHQLSRLKTHFPQAFGELAPDNAKIEILLLMVNPVEDDTRNAVLSLVQKINQRGKCQGLERIVMACNEGEAWTLHS